MSRFSPIISGTLGAFSCKNPIKTPDNFHLVECILPFQPRGLKFRIGSGAMGSYASRPSLWSRVETGWTGTIPPPGLYNGIFFGIYKV